MAFKHTTIEDIQSGYAELRKSFQDKKTLPLEFRRAQLLQLARLFQENTVGLSDALHADLGRHKLDLEEWNKPEKPAVEEWRSSWDTTIYTRPKGLILIIGPWNYPYVTAMLPLIGAIAAGCTAIVKPSEFNPACAQLLADLFPKYLDASAYRIVNGAVPETTALLDLKWDHIFFTGSGRIGRVVARCRQECYPRLAGAGRQVPVFIDADNTDVELAAKRILWGKQQNAGQICVAPDYILVPRAQQDAVMGSILNPHHHARLTELLGRTQGTIAHGGNSEGTKRIEPTVVTDVKLNDALMEDELFGPIIPIVPVDDRQEAIQVIQGRPVPLVIYVFTDSEETKNKCASVLEIVESTSSGTLVLNDTVAQLGVHEIPFGGQGESGYGLFSGKYSFETFVNRRSYINVPPAIEPYLKYRYPPYTEEAFQALSAPANMKIPDH
ncbi:Aldehyde/histidinol dehydrogenase [Mycena olivaceomarginata]|nr:Aldehyde/histidinol dehydrogenase [Mycena olivaceomarginata]